MDNESSNPQLDKFIPTTSNFSTLPLELRQQVWVIVANEARNVDIWTNYIRIPPSDNPTPPRVYRFRTTQPTPSILHINSEAREIGLQFYEPSFGKQFTRGSWTYQSPARIWVNRYADRLCPMGKYDQVQKMDILAFCRLSNNSPSDVKTPESLKPRRSIALNTSDFLDHGAQQAMLNEIWDHSSKFYREILIYKRAYQDKDDPAQPMNFHFIDLEEHNPDTRGRWISVNAVKQYVLQSIKDRCMKRQQTFISIMRRMGKEVREEDWQEWRLPEVRIVDISRS